MRHAILPPTAFHGLAGGLVTGVSVVVAMIEGEPLATTAGSVVAASWDPPLLAVFFRADSRAASALDAAARFTVNVLSEADHGLAHRFAHPDRSQGWKALADIAFHRRDPAPPVLRSAAAWAECAVTQTLPTGDHRCYIGHVLDCERRVEAAPLVYYRGRLRGVGNAVAPAHWSAVDIGDLAAVW
jgi:3-hydroxy-9,10-secoandrosta-1,3,5(10)-triene-9,17-dione monooxygenase reductase component